MECDNTQVVRRLNKEQQIDEEESEENDQCLIDIKSNEDNVGDMQCSDPSFDSHYLTVPNMFTWRSPGFLKAEDSSKESNETKIRHKRSHSIDHVATSGNSTPSRKLSVVSVDRHKTKSRIVTLSSNFLNASISNINRCSSAKNLFSFFANGQRGVRDWSDTKKRSTS